MSVYATMIRDDPDSRARLRVTPEQALNFPNHHCLASWIAAGSRIPSFMGQTYPWPTVGDAMGAPPPRRAMAERVGPYPDELASTLERTLRQHAHPTPPRARSPDGAIGIRPRRCAPKPRHGPAPKPTRPPQPRAPTTAPPRRRPGSGRRKREVRVDIEPPPPPPRPARPGRAPDRRPPAHRPAAATTRTPGARQPARTRLPRPHQRDLRGPARAARRAPPAPLRRRLRDPRAARPRRPRPARADRRAVLPDRAPSAVAERLTKLYRAGLIARHTTGLRQRERSDGKPPLLYSLTRHGLEVAQARHPTPAISHRREWRAIEQYRAARLGHDLHALGWAIALHRTVGTIATDNWRTPRYATGRYPVPQIGSATAGTRSRSTRSPSPDGHAIIDVAQKPFTEIKPDLSLELRIDALNLTFDLLVELDLTGRPSYNRDKLLAYDAFLTGWSSPTPATAPRHTPDRRLRLP